MCKIRKSIFADIINGLYVLLGMSAESFDECEMGES